MPTPVTPPPALIVRWMTRARYLRWLDGAVGALLLWAVGLLLAPLTAQVAALLALGVSAAAAQLPSVRAQWRPVSGVIGIAVSRGLRPGDRAWWITAHRSEPVIVTGRHGLRLTIALAGHGEAEVLGVRRTRTVVVPAERRV